MFIDVLRTPDKINLPFARRCIERHGWHECRELSGIIPASLAALLVSRSQLFPTIVRHSRRPWRSNTVEYSLSSRLAIEVQRQAHLGNFISTGVLRECRKITNPIRPSLRTASGVARRSNTGVFSLLAPCWPHAAPPSVLDWLFRDTPLIDLGVKTADQVSPVVSKLCIAKLKSWPSEDTSSLLYILRRWTRTVCSDTLKRPAMSGAELPRSKC